MRLLVSWRSLWIGFIMNLRDIISECLYHIAVWLFLVTKDKKIFLSQRSKNKSRVYMWEPSGGSMLQGETVVKASIREQLGW